MARASATTAGFVLRQLALAARSRWHRFGYACVVFGSPISMRRYLGLRRLDFRAPVSAERSAALAALGAELMAAVGAAVPVVPVALVAAVFVDRAGGVADGAGERADPGAGALSRLELKAAVCERMAALAAAGATVYVPRRDQDYAVEAGLRMLLLRHLVEERDGLFAARAEELPLLRYYANSIAHFAAPAALAALAALAAIDAEPAAAPPAGPAAVPAAVTASAPSSGAAPQLAVPPAVSSA